MENEKQKGKVSIVAILALVICAVLVVLTVFELGAIRALKASNESLSAENQKFYEEQNKYNQKVDGFIDDQLARQAEELATDTEYVEDGYLVGETYEIKSTTEISDAYQNGDPSSLSAEDKETYDMAVAVIDEVIKPEQSNYEKELAIYEWLLDHVNTGSSTVVSRPGTNSVEGVSTPHGVLSGRSSVCVGYATTFRMFMNMLGMDCHIVHNEYHSWDLVQMDDGEWYHVDVYSDNDSIRYRNFNMTDSQCRNSHSWDGGNYLPEADGVEFNYANQNSEYIDDFTDIPARVFEKINGVNRGVSMYYRFNGGITTDRFDEGDVLISQMQMALQGGYIPGFENKYMEASWVNLPDEDYALAIYVNDWSGYEEPGAGTDSAVSPDESHAIIDAINQAFGIELPYTDAEYVGGDMTYDNGMISPWNDGMTDTEVLVEDEAGTLAAEATQEETTEEVADDAV